MRRVIAQWIRENPYSYGINWACTMEVALRILSWTWFFHVFSGSQAWSDQAFQLEFLRSLYLQAIFTEQHLEKSDISGNHYTANAAGLVYAGLFFGKGASARKWAEKGWNILTEELPRQVYEDGVDFEASVAYHRLVFELFLATGTLSSLWEGICRSSIGADFERWRISPRHTLGRTAPFRCGAMPTMRARSPSADRGLMTIVICWVLWAAR